MYKTRHIWLRMYAFFNLIDWYITHSSRKSWNSFWHRSARSSRTWAAPVVRSATSILFELRCDQLSHVKKFGAKISQQQDPGWWKWSSMSGEGWDGESSDEITRVGSILSVSVFFKFLREDIEEWAESSEASPSSFLPMIWMINEFSLGRRIWQNSTIDCLQSDYLFIRLQE